MVRDERPADTWTAEQTAESRRRHDPILGPELRCSMCHEWWPEDPEFYYFQGRRILVARCKACWLDYNRSRRKPSLEGAA